MRSLTCAAAAALVLLFSFILGAPIEADEPGFEAISDLTIESEPNETKSHTVLNSGISNETIVAVIAILGLAAIALRKGGGVTIIGRQRNRRSTDVSVDVGKKGIGVGLAVVVVAGALILAAIL